MDNDSKDTGKPPSERSLIDAAQRVANEARRLMVDAGLPDAPPNSSFMGGSSIPGYDVRNEIHRGGQGIVYRATQNQTGRDVAIKIMRDGPFGGPKQRCRFDREVNILGILEHPNIVAIHDTGSTADSSYYVMDYIDGQSLDVFVTGVQSRGNPRSSTRELLALFVRICEAVHTAHVLGIVHRDLKPRNILIDSTGAPKILDFGLAKIPDGNSSEVEPTVMTITGQFVGSLPWSSPEQAEGKLDELDARSDVYALGVMLYQFLAGRFPYPVIGNVRDVVNHILHDEPAALSTSHAHLDDEIDTIVLNCLHKDRDRRYVNAGALALDLQRYLEGTPIEAKRDSRYYLLKKALHRYRVPVVIAACFVLLITASTVIFWGLYIHADSQAQIAKRERQSAVAAQEAETKARLTAEHEASKARQIQRFLTDMLAAADPYEGRGDDITVRSVIDAAALRLEAEGLEPPGVAGSVHRTLARTYKNLGEFDAAEGHVRQARDLFAQEYGEEGEATLITMNELSSILSEQGQFDEAESLLRETHALRERLLGPDDLDTTTTVNDLAVLLRRKGEYAEAEQLARTAYEIRRRDAGTDTECTLVTANTLASILESQGKLAEAEPLFRQVVEHRRVTLDPEHPDLLGSLNNLGNLLRARKNYTEAEPVLSDTVRISQSVFGENHPNTLIACNNLALVYQGLDDLEEAATWFKTAYDGADEHLGSDHMVTLIFQGNYGRCLARLERFAEAETHLLHAEEGLTRVLGDAHSRTMFVRKRLALLYNAWDKPDEAVKWRANPIEP